MVRNSGGSLAFGLIESIAVVVATVALRASINSIKKKGEGLVEAYPATRKGFPAGWFGTLSMFKKEGFEVVAPFGKRNVLVRQMIIP